MKISLAALAIAAISLSPALAQEAAAPAAQPPAAASDSAADMTNVTSPQDFADKAGVANMFEIESSKVALEKATSDDVKNFAQKMIDDHTKAGDDMKAAADSQGGITVPTELDDAHQQMLDQLNNASGDDFDQTYIQMQTDAHKQAVALFDAYSKNGEDGALKDFAAKTLPTLQQHYDMVQQLGNGAMGSNQGNAMAPANDANANAAAGSNANANASGADANANANANNGANAGSAAPAPADNNANAPAPADNNAAAPATPMAPAPNAAAPANNNAAATQNQAAGIDVSTLTPLDLTTLKGDDLKGMDVLDPQGEKIADINDFVLTDDGKIDAVIVDFGGFLGIGTKQVALAFEGLNFVGDQNGNRYLVVDVTKEQLDAQPAYNKDDYAANRDTQLLNVSK